MYEKILNGKKNQEEPKEVKTFSVRLSSVDKVKGFVRDMSRIESDVLLFAGKYVIDAKSIMGIFSLDLSGPLQVQIEDWSKDYAPMIEKYLD